VFWGWIFTALVESTFISALPLFTLANSSRSSGNSESFLMAGMTAFTVIVLIVNFKVRLYSSPSPYRSSAPALCVVLSNRNFCVQMH
jgi:hypothetical protein